MTDLPKLRLGSDAVSPTAHYTGHVWVRNGLSHPELATWEGRAMFNALEPAMVASRALGGPTLEDCCSPGTGSSMTFSRGRSRSETFGR
jgi:hypothetical protein